MFLLCVIDIFSKYAWVILLKDKKGVAITNAFQNFLKETNCKPNKIWLDKLSEFYDRSMKSFLQNDNLELYLTYNEGKFVVAERVVWNVRVSKWKNIFAKGHLSNWSEKDFLVRKVKKHCHVDILTEKKLLDRFTKKNCKKQIKKSLELKK